MSEDQALLLRYARSQDAEAFALLVKKYSTLVFSVALRVTKNAATAEDVAQDCFLRLARQAAAIQGSLPGWLHRVALNRSLDVNRAEASRKRCEERTAKSAIPESAPTWEQIAPHVDAALAELPSHLRDPLVQRFLLGRTQTEIGADLGVNQATVSRRLELGIEMLRQLLKQNGVVCGAAALPTLLTSQASATVPASLSTSLMKMALAGVSGVKKTTVAGLLKSYLGVKTVFVALAATASVAVISSAVFFAAGKAPEAVTAESLRQGLVLHLSFDQAEPENKVTDGSGRNNHGKVSGAHWTPEGKKGGAYQFAADGDQIEVADAASLNPKRITLSAWIKTDYSDATWRRIFDKSYAKGYAMSVAGDVDKSKWMRGLAAIEITGGEHINYSKKKVVDENWRHIVATFDGTEQRLYVDGVQQGAALRWNKPDEVGAAKFNLVIGRNRSNLGEPDLGTSFRGIIDEPMIWDRALSAEEVQFLFKSQR